jgi:multicomponent Na+:H+ antiporter subunit G
MDPVLLVRFGLGGALLAVGVAIVVVSSIGMLRLPDVYTRVHALTADANGGAIAVFGLAIASADGALLLLLGTLSLLMFVLAPMHAALIANAAHSGGLAPLSGRHVAPRPGEPTL